MDLMLTESRESAGNGAILHGTDFDILNDFIKVCLGNIEC